VAWEPKVELAGLANDDSKGGKEKKKERRHAETHKKGMEQDDIYSGCTSHPLNKRPRAFTCERRRSRERETSNLLMGQNVWGQ
jgi:hypothetical protein